ncbi:Histone H4 acetyltransferase [Heracleum sosnowskyi]|uniref:Histone H4 acetyltransferase n=1 Tax=Heracleum sosnowskyi TaxID=360622 RepID=A0AAD8LZ46_9APIA|nr:Histone H4 acetyltransferase [Heracleum sosnowskyi]
MEHEEQKPCTNPSGMLNALLCKRAKLHEELRVIEKQVYDMETSYLQDPSQCGNVLKGFEGFLSSTKSTNLLKRSRKFGPEDRLFSLSSITSPAVLVEGGIQDVMIYLDASFACEALTLKLQAEEHAAARDAGGLLANGQGKPKRGRWPRDGRRSKQSSEPDFDYDDDPDVIL